MRAFVFGLGAAVGVCAFASPALAFKPTSHIYTADVAVASILGRGPGTLPAPVRPGVDSVRIDGRDYAVPAAVARSIRDFPSFYRGGVVGPDAFPDVPTGQGSIHPDNRTNNGQHADTGLNAGASFTWEWLDFVYGAGWDAYRACGGCAAGEQDLAWTYGFLTHAAGDVWAHTFVNHYARGVFPAYAEILTSQPKLGIALRHVIVEGYIDRHAPPMSVGDLAIDAPLDFIYRTLIASDRATQLGQGFFIKGFLGLRASLQADRARLATRISDIENECAARSPLPDHHCIQRGPNNAGDAAELVVKRGEEAYIDAWTADITTGLRAWPGLSLEIARNLFVTRTPSISAVQDAAGVYVRKYLLSMLGFPDAVGAALTAISNFSSWLSDEIARATPAPIKELRAEIAAAQTRLIDFVVYRSFGRHLDELVGYLTHPETYVNSSAAPISLGQGTSKSLDDVMGLTVDGVANPTAPWNPAGDSAAFPVAHDAIVLSKLVLLDDAALDQLLADHGVPMLYQPGDNVMLGWPRSIDASNQWRKYSLLDGRRYGEGTFPLWQDCRARPLVFRALFEDWEHGTAGPFPDDAAPGRAADIADCHGWTTVNKAPGLVSVSFGTAGDGSQSVLFRTSVLTLPTKPVGRPKPLRTIAATPLPGAIPVPKTVSVGLVYARRHLASPAETVSFTYDTGGDAKGVALVVLGDGRRLTTLTASGPVTLSNVAARDLTFQVQAPTLALAGSTAWFGRVADLVVTAQGWSTALTAGTSGLDADAASPDALVFSAAPAGGDPTPLAGSASATRRFADPVFTVNFHYRPAFDPALVRLSVLADGAVVRVLTGGEQNVTLTGLAAHALQFRWEALAPGPLAAVAGASLSNLRVMQQSGVPPTPAQQPSAPATGGGSLPDSKAPSIVRLRLTLVRRPHRALDVTFRLDEISHVRAALFVRNRLVAVRSVSGRVGPNRIRLPLPARPARLVATLELTTRDAAGNLRVVRRQVRLR